MLSSYGRLSFSKGGRCVCVHVCVVSADLVGDDAGVGGDLRV